MSRRNPKKKEVERLKAITVDSDHSMNVRMKALEGLVDHGAIKELTKIAKGPKWPDDLREEAVFGLVALNATEELSNIAKSDKCPSWMRGMARELLS